MCAHNITLFDIEHCVTSQIYLGFLWHYSWMLASLKPAIQNIKIQKLTANGWNLIKLVPTKSQTCIQLNICTNNASRIKRSLNVIILIMHDIRKFSLLMTYESFLYCIIYCHNIHSKFLARHYLHRSKISIWANL